MVTPDFNKITPVRKETSVQSSEDTERKAPSGDFEKVAKEVDEREKGGGDNDFSKKDKKKVPAGPLTSSNNEDTPLLTPFQLARGQRDNQDEHRDSLKDLFGDVTDAPKPKKVQVQFAPPSENTISQAQQVPQHAPQQVPQQLTQQASQQAPQQVTAVPFETKLTKAESKFTETKTATARYSTEQPDLAEVNPLGNSQQATQATYIPPVFAIDPSMTAEATTTVKTPQPLQSIQEVIDQIVEKVYTVKQTGDTEVIVDLKGSFAGSRLTVTESDSARGQFNITIDNLTGPNQALIEAHKTKIMDTLLESGVQVQRFTASTTVESSRIDVATDNTRDREGRDSPQEDNPRDRRRQKSNDKT